MRIGIHHQKGSYSNGWISYCEEKEISYKIVNAYSSDIVKKLADCDAFMWHHHQARPKDVLFAKQLLFSLEQAGKIVYPDWKTGWHFDDKLGQKYLLEAMQLPLIPSYVFFSKSDALEWVNNYSFPAVFKLRGGASSYNVWLVKDKIKAKSIIKKAFGRGFRQFDPKVSLRENFKKFKSGKGSILKVLKSFSFFILPYKIEKSKGKEKGYSYFQEFIPDCKYDIRVQLIGDKCYAMTRNVRENDFRASGGGKIDYDGSKVPPAAIKLTFEVASILKMQSIAIDLLPWKDNYLIAEISYAFAIDEGELDFGYYDKNLKWHKGVINPFGWMVDDIIQAYKEKQLNKTIKDKTTNQA